MKYILAFVIGAGIMAGLDDIMMNHACAADLALPHRQSMQVAPLPPTARHVIPAVPIAPAIPSPRVPQTITPDNFIGRGPERCLETGKEPFPGQTLQADTSCPTGLRWIFQK